MADVFYRVIFWAVGFPASLEEFALDFLLADATLEALLVVHLAKCSAALICHRLVANLAFSCNKGGGANK